LESDSVLGRQTLHRLARGRELFNRGRHFEAHEVWEEAWLEEKGPARQILQGLIQVAAGCYKAAVQNQPAGCVRLLAEGLSKLADAPEEFAGLDLALFRREIAETLEEARRWQRGERSVAPARLPSLAKSGKR